MKLTKRQESILLGTILGDGYLQKTGVKNARLKLEHGDVQKEYLIWKGKQFPRLFLGKPIYLERIHPKTNRTYKYWRWQSNSTPIFGDWHRLFYKNGKKCLPVDLIKLLNQPLALAIWYMDDGYFHHLNHNCYSMLYLGRISLEEAKIAGEAIVRNFNIQPKVYDKKKKGYALFFPVVETKKLHDLIRPHMLSIFNYKLYSL